MVNFKDVYIHYLINSPTTLEGGQSCYSQIFRWGNRLREVK